MNDNIPAGYDENGVRNGTGKWNDKDNIESDSETCEFCGSANIGYKACGKGGFKYCLDCERAVQISS